MLVYIFTCCRFRGEIDLNKDNTSMTLCHSEVLDYKHMKYTCKLESVQIPNSDIIIMYTHMHGS